MIPGEGVSGSGAQNGERESKYTLLSIDSPFIIIIYKQTCLLLIMYMHVLTHMLLYMYVSQYYSCNLYRKWRGREAKFSWIIVL